MDTFVDILTRSIFNSDSGEDAFGIYIKSTKCNVIALHWFNTAQGLEYNKKQKLSKNEISLLEPSEIVWEHEIKEYRGFPITTVCHTDCVVILPKERNSDGLKSLYEFSKLLVKEGIIDKASIEFVRKECGCT